MAMIETTITSSMSVKPRPRTACRHAGRLRVTAVAGDGASVEKQDMRITLSAHPALPAAAGLLCVADGEEIRRFVKWSASKKERVRRGENLR
jgi:hypothetical protein